MRNGNGFAFLKPEALCYIGISDRKEDYSMQDERREESQRRMGLVWKDRKHWMWFPFSFTKYRVENDRLYVKE